MASSFPEVLEWERIFESWKPFRAEEVLWFRVAQRSPDK